jgi:hypothetical protein
MFRVEEGFYIFPTNQCISLKFSSLFDLLPLYKQLHGRVALCTNRGDLKKLIMKSDYPMPIEPN